MEHKGGLMYGKIFESMYDGTLHEDYKAMIVFMHMIILANEDGVVDMTPKAMASRTGTPIEYFVHGIDKLEKPDLESRSPEEKGCRIMRIDDHRKWGWYIVNYDHYRKMGSREDKKKADRVRIKKKRANSRKESQGVVKVAHTNTDTNTNKEQQEYPFWLNQSHWSEYKKHRKEMKSPMTERAELLAIAKLKRLVDAGHSQERVVEQSIEMGWKGLFAVKDGVADSEYTKPPECGSCGQVSSSIKKGLKCPYCEKVV